MKIRIVIFALGLLAVVALAAGCAGGDAPATIPPPPTPLENQPPAEATVINQPTAVAPELETAVAGSSPTPVETPTLAPTATAKAETADPQSQPVAAGSLPPTSYDLLFIAEGALKRWQAASGQVLTLIPGGDEAASDEKRDAGLPIVGDVAGYSLSRDGRRAAVARLTASTPISDTTNAVTVTVQTYALSYLDLETGSQRELVPAVNIVGRLSFALSQDGRHLAFGGWSLGQPSGSLASGAQNGSLYMVETETGAAPQTISSCAPQCHDFVWHPDNNFFVYGDGGGLFLYNLSASQPELLAGDPAATRYYGPISWAKNGRWLLMWLGLGVEGADRAIFDVPTKQTMTIPNTFQYADPLYAELTWMQDDRLFLVRAESPEGPAIGETWRVNVDAGEVQRDESVVLSTEVAHPTAPVHWANGRFGYGLINRDSSEGTGLFQRISFNEPAERVGAMPAAQYAPEVAWLPDGSGAAIAQQGRLYYAPADGVLYDMQPVVGSLAQDLTWLP